MSEAISESVSQCNGGVPADTESTLQCFSLGYDT